MGFPDGSVGNESACNAGDPSSISGSGRSVGERVRLPTAVFFGFPCGSAGKESACNAGELGLIPGFGRSPGEEKGYPLQYSSLENSMFSMLDRRIGKDSETFTFLQKHDRTQYPYERIRFV